MADAAFWVHIVLLVVSVLSLGWFFNCFCRLAKHTRKELLARLLLHLICVDGLQVFVLVTEHIVSTDSTSYSDVFNNLSLSLFLVPTLLDSYIAFGIHQHPHPRWKCFRAPPFWFVYIAYGIGVAYLTFAFASFRTTRTATLELIVLSFYFGFNLIVSSASYVLAIRRCKGHLAKLKITRRLASLSIAKNATESVVAPLCFWLLHVLPHKEDSTTETITHFFRALRATLDVLCYAVSHRVVLVGLRKTMGSITGQHEVERRRRMDRAADILAIRLDVLVDSDDLRLTCLESFTGRASYRVDVNAASSTSPAAHSWPAGKISSRNVLTISTEWAAGREFQEMTDAQYVEEMGINYSILLLESFAGLIHGGASADETCESMHREVRMAKDTIQESIQAKLAARNEILLPGGLQELQARIAKGQDTAWHLVEPLLGQLAEIETLDVVQEEVENMLTMQVKAWVELQQEKDAMTDEVYQREEKLAELIPEAVAFTDGLVQAADANPESTILKLQALRSIKETIDLIRALRLEKHEGVHSWMRFVKQHRDVGYVWPASFDVDVASR